MSRRSFLPVVVFSCSCLFAAAADAGLNGRSAVSVNGLDSNACTTTAPCRSFSVAIAATVANGEVIALDTAGFGTFTVSQSMTISGAPGVHAGVTVNSGTGISVAAGSSDRIILRNLVLIGGGGNTGIYENTAGEVRVIGCLIRGFSGGYGISVASGNISVERTALLDNNLGIALGDFGFPVHGTITDSLFQGNVYGVLADVDSHVVVVHSTITGNSNTGATASCGEGLPPVSTDLTLESCTISGNAVGVSSNGNGSGFVANVYLAANVISFNTTGVSTLFGGATFSFGNNRLAGNGADGGPFTSIAYQ